MSWVAPASISNHTGYPGDLKFPGRCDRFYPNIPIFLQFDDQDMALGLQKFADQNLVTRMEVPRSTVTWNRELERRQAARQVEPGGEGGVVVGGFSSTSRFDSNISAFSG